MADVATESDSHQSTLSETAAHLGGFRSLDEETRLAELPLTGKLPAWLEGSLIRTGPARWEIGEQQMRHWFDGFAMLHRFGFAAGKVSYANRFLESKAYRSAKQTGEISYSEFATDPCRSLFSRIFSVFSPKISDNANVNLVELGGRFIAMTETPLPIEFDPETLATAGVAYEAPGLLTTAHPHLDRASGGMLNYATKVGPRNRYRFFRICPDATAADLIGELPTREPAYMHSFGLTERWLVLVEFPFVVNPISIPLSGRPYIENFQWKPELGTRLTLFDRTTGETTGPFETDPCFAFHHVNAYDEENEVVIDICAYEDASIIGDLYMERLRAGQPIVDPELRRFRVETDSGRVTSERLLHDGGSSCHESTTDAATSDLTATCGESEARTQAGWTRSFASTWRCGRASDGRRTAASLASPCSLPHPGHPTRTREFFSLSSSTPTRTHRSCLHSMLARSTRSPVPRRHTTFPMDSTASSPHDRHRHRRANGSESEDRAEAT